MNMEGPYPPIPPPLYYEPLPNYDYPPPDNYEQRPYHHQWR